MGKKQKAKILRLWLSAILVCALVPSASAAALAASDTTGLIGTADAKTIALGNAGISISDTHYCSGYLEYVNKAPSYYQIEFVAGSTRYNYRIGAYDGTVLSYGTQNLAYNYAPKSAAPSKTDKDSVTVTGDIGQEAAKQAALNQAGVTASQTDNLKIKRELKKDGLQYKVEFKANNTKYKYTVDGISGKIIK